MFGRHCSVVIIIFRCIAYTHGFQTFNVKLNSDTNKRISSVFLVYLIHNRHIRFHYVCNKNN